MISQNKRKMLRLQEQEKRCGTEGLFVAVGRKLLTPNHPAGTPTSESLNVAIATATVLSEFRRRDRRG